MIHCIPESIWPLFLKILMCNHINVWRNYPDWLFFLCNSLEMSMSPNAALLHHGQLLHVYIQMSNIMKVFNHRLQWLVFNYLDWFSSWSNFWMSICISVVTYTVILLMREMSCSAKTTSNDNTRVLCHPLCHVVQCSAQCVDFWTKD